MLTEADVTTVHLEGCSRNMCSEHTPSAQEDSIESLLSHGADSSGDGSTCCQIGLASVILLNNSCCVKF